MNKINTLKPKEMRVMLKSILEQLDGVEWNADALASISQTFRLFGVEVKDLTFDE